VLFRIELHVVDSIDQTGCVVGHPQGLVCDLEGC
jgi:hypothetical protein